MPGVRNIDEELTVLEREDLTIAADTASVSSSVIVQDGYDRGLMFAVELDDVIGAGALEYKVEISDDNVTYTDAPDESYSPSFKQTAAQRILEDTENSRQQPIGCSCAARYSKLTITTDGVVTAATASVTVIKEAEQRPDTSWTTTIQPGGGLP